MDEGPQVGSHEQDESEDESANFPTFRILFNSFSIMIMMCNSTQRKCKMENWK